MKRGTDNEEIISVTVGTFDASFLCGVQQLSAC